MSSLSLEELKSRAQMFVVQIVQGDFAIAIKTFDDHMKTTFNEAKLQESWQNIIEEAGSLIQLAPILTKEMDGYKIVVIRCNFQIFGIDVQVVFNEKAQISGLNFIPIQMAYNPPEYVDESAFHEVEVTVGEGKWALPGTLTIPNGSGPFQGLILVHGSGPNDRDETVGPNKTFRDLAWGLASKGIAVLRYDKRTFKHAKKLTPDMIVNMTVKEEVIDDALLAIQLMRKTEFIDSNRIFLLGHSLGATIAPRIGEKDTKLTGLIIMAGITRPLEDTILDQFTYIYSLTETITDQQKAELETLKAKVQKLKDPELSNTLTTQDMPLGIPVIYWRDLKENNPLDAVKNLSMPILILQGGRDYQVLKTKDYEGWKTALNRSKNATFKLFTRLNHLFIAGEGISTPQEYSFEGHVDKEVVDTIIQWIKDID